MTPHVRFLNNIDTSQALLHLRHRPVNYTVKQVGRPGWHFDTHRHYLAHEPPGPPEPGGPWQVACRLVRDYEFSVPDLVRAVYDRRDSLLGRDMLLEGRFLALRFYMGVRVTDVIDETRNGNRRTWGWSYETLEGHLERGKMTYEVVKDTDSGRVEFVITGYSQRSPTLGPVTRLGWALFGRRTQLRFYRQCGARLHTLVQTERTRPPTPPPAGWGNIVLAPSDVRPTALERIAIRRQHPGSPKRR